MVALFIIFTVVHAPNAALVCIVLAFVIPIPAFAWSFALMLKMERLVRSEYTIKGPFRPPLSFRVLRSTDEFDRWLFLQTRIRR